MNSPDTYYRARLRQHGVYCSKGRKFWSSTHQSRGILLQHGQEEGVPHRRNRQQHHDADRDDGRYVRQRPFQEPLLPGGEALPPGAPLEKPQRHCHVTAQELRPSPGILRTMQKAPLAEQWR